MKTQFEQMMNGLNDVEAFLAGKQEGFKAHVPQEVDVKAIRNRLGMTQARFSNTFGFSLDAIKHWEGGRRSPEAPARTLLTVIDKNPAAVLTALNPAAFAAAVGSSKPTADRVRVDRKRQTSSGVKRKTHSTEGGKRTARGKSLRIAGRIGHRKNRQRRRTFYFSCRIHSCRNCRSRRLESVGTEGEGLLPVRQGFLQQCDSLRDLLPVPERAVLILQQNQLSGRRGSRGATGFL